MSDLKPNSPLPTYPAIRTANPPPNKLPPATFKQIAQSTALYKRVCVIAILSKLRQPLGY